MREWDSYKRRNKRSTHISDVIKDYLEQEHLSQKIYEQRAIKLWDEVVGEYAAKATLKISMNNGTMFVKINSSVIRNEALLRKNHLMDSINAKVGRHIVLDLVIT